LTSSPGLARRARWRIVRDHRATVVGLVLFGALAVLAVGAPLLSPFDPAAQSTADRLSAPGHGHLLGRDTFGRDVASRLVWGGRVSLVVGLTSVAVGCVLGTACGLVAGSSSRQVEQVLMRLVDALMAFPSLLLGLLVAAVLGAGLERLILAIGIVLAPSFGRLAYGATLSLRGVDFVVAAQAMGASRLRILSRHVLPSMLNEIVVLASLLTASAIRIEAGLSFIGLGLAPPTPTWGNMIHDGVPLLFSAPWLSLVPGLAILLAVLAFNLIGDGVRDALDPRLAVSSHRLAARREGTCGSR
jgi:peptide/nickel transport system permease protein